MSNVAAVTYNICVSQIKMVPAELLHTFVFETRGIGLVNFAPGFQAIAINLSNNLSIIQKPCHVYNINT